MDMSTHHCNLSAGIGGRPSGESGIFGSAGRDHSSAASVHLPAMPDSICSLAPLRSMNDTATCESSWAQRGGVGVERLARNRKSFHRSIACSSLVALVGCFP